MAPAVVIRGPRQIGKTTAQLQFVQDLLDGGFPANRVFRVQFDDIPELKKLGEGGGEPILRLVDWFESKVLGETLNEAARSGPTPILLFDEVQNLRRWAEQLKSLVDSSTVRVVVTGSSALRIERGRDSLAGRITTIDAGTLSLVEIGQFTGIDVGPSFLGAGDTSRLVSRDFWAALAVHGRSIARERDEVFARFSARGGYPFAHQRGDLPWSELAEHLNETVIRRVIRHDLRVGERGRKRDEALLEEVFRLACRYAGTSTGAMTMAKEIRQTLSSNVGPQRIRHYLSFLDETMLIRLVGPLEVRLKKRKGDPRICLADHALRASWLQEVIPLDPSALREHPHLADMAGRIAESVAGACLSTLSPEIALSHLPQRGDEPEVDFVMTMGAVRIPVEIKYRRRLDPLRDTAGLRVFLEKAVNNAPFGILVTQTDTDDVVDPRIVTLPLASLLLSR